MLPTNKKALIIYALIFIAALIFMFSSEPVSQEGKSANSGKTVNIQEWKTKNGIRVLYVYAPELPMVIYKLFSMQEVCVIVVSPELQI